MRVVSITDVRQDATRLVQHVNQAREPVLVLQRSRPAAYLVDAVTYEAMDAELKHLRHEQFWQEVAEASDEYQAGSARVYDDVDQLIADLALEEDQKGPERSAPSQSAALAE